ncbi:unnamed protein product [Anisakis simplex]|uniref:Metallophos domain-containing protein n=1 Tax=Anisakis simplex TaxID=6269 RepID=A0A0M3K4H9_ANISI|nr:unnamed protein product [Anisakis simplex]
MLHQILFSVLILCTTFRITSASQFLQLTDLHYDKDYSSQFGSRSNKCHNATKPSDLPKKRLGQFGDYACDAPKSLIRNALNAAYEILPNPDFIFWTGDSIPHIDNYDETSKFPNVRVLPLFGNRDYAPANAFPDHNCLLYERIFNLWKRWIGTANRHTFLKGGYYKYVLGNKVVVLALNTNLYYRLNRAIPRFKNPDDPADQFQFMIDTLNDARAKQLFVHVIAHIAPGVFERTPNFKWMVPKYNQRFIDITIEYADTIKWMIFGHHHTDTFHIVKDPKTHHVAQVYLMAPAVAPWFSSLEGTTSNNPAFRIYEYDETTQRLIDAKTYSVNLTKLNRFSYNRSIWELEYSMAQTYQIKMHPKQFALLADGITPETMHGVLNKLKRGGDALKNYIEYNSVRWNVSIPEGKLLYVSSISLTKIQME